MFEFHGWATIRESPSEVDTARLHTIIEELHEVRSCFGWQHAVLDLRSVNGEYQLSSSGLTNHRATEAGELHEFFNRVAQVAPGSYGLLFVRDDEDPNGSSNQFRVWVLARGKFIEREDVYLSPFVPTAEDP